jgi:hypothetical protein
MNRWVWRRRPASEGFYQAAGTLDALPMPLGSLTTRGLAGSNGTPLIGELPAPADPAGGVSCPYALTGAAAAKR